VHGLLALQKTVLSDLASKSHANSARALGFPLDENKHVERCPQFDLTILNEKEKLSIFKQYVKEVFK